jgi:hypothetical protein
MSKKRVGVEASPEPLQSQERVATANHSLKREGRESHHRARLRATGGGGDVLDGFFTVLQFLGYLLEALGAFLG